jgi:hypothetical protein
VERSKDAPGQPNGDKHRGATKTEAKRYKQCPEDRTQNRSNVVKRFVPQQKTAAKETQGSKEEN